jgi:hypothetical protein
MRKYRTDYWLWVRLFGLLFLPPFALVSVGAVVDYVEFDGFRPQVVRFTVGLVLWGTAAAAAVSWLLQAVVVMNRTGPPPDASGGQAADYDDKPPAAPPTS